MALGIERLFKKPDEIIVQVHVLPPFFLLVTG
jgi:hypothetical protein